MKFAKVVFLLAGVWGIAVLTPLFWLVDISGRRYTPPADDPQFFYGFIAVAMLWQIVFLAIASNPVRFRPLMIIGVLEKLTYVTIVTVLYAQSRIGPIDAQAAIPDGLIGILFIWAYFKTPAQRA